MLGLIWQGNLFWVHDFAQPYLPDESVPKDAGAKRNKPALPCFDQDGSESIGFPNSRGTSSLNTSWGRSSGKATEEAERQRIERGMAGGAQTFGRELLGRQLIPSERLERRVERLVHRCLWTGSNRHRQTKSAGRLRERSAQIFQLLGLRSWP